MPKEREIVVCEAGSFFWYVRSQEELDRMAARDRETGNTLDDAGEPRLYSKIGAAKFNDTTLVAITRKRNVPWPHWTRKPKHLMEGLATVNGVTQLVLISTSEPRRS